MKRCVVAVALVAVSLSGGLSSTAHATTLNQILQFIQVCKLPQLGHASCHAIRADGFAAVHPSSSTSTPAGYGPADLQSAYKLPSSTAGSGQTVAIVDAYDDPNAQADLDVYRSQYGLPSCDAGCFTKVDQTGGTNYPTADSGWSQEISLDLDMVSAICPNCHILLVEASSSNMTDLGAAENEAASLGANEISNSWGSSEYSTQTSDDNAYFNHPGIAITASSGDSGYGVGYPASSRYVTGVGGTTLKRASTTSRGWTETAWTCSGFFGCWVNGGAGSGCSKYETKPSWQHDSGCSKRTEADVSAIADPNTGVAVYDTYQSSGWLVFGGTSVASPIIASVYALAGNASTVTAGTNYGSYPYSHAAGNLNDVVKDTSNTVKCSPSYLCNAVTGYDGPTGLGTPNGVGAF